MLETARAIRTLSNLYPSSTSTSGLRMYHIKGEPHVLDIELGEWLELGFPHEIRRRIRENLADMAVEGPLLSQSVTTLKNGIRTTSEGYLINRGHAYKLVARMKSKDRERQLELLKNGYAAFKDPSFRGQTAFDLPRDGESRAIEVVAETDVGTARDGGEAEGREVSPMPTAVMIPGYDLPMYEFDGELYCKDVDLGRAIGLAEPRYVRRTISSNIKLLEKWGIIVHKSTMIETGKGARREVDVVYLNQRQALAVTALSRTDAGTELMVMMTDVYIAWANGKLTGPADEPAPVLSLEDMSDTEILDRQVRRSIAGLANAYLGSRRPGAIDSGLAYKIGHDGFTAASDPETGALEVIVADEHGRPALRIGSEPNPVDPTRTVLIADGLQLARFLKVDVGALMARLCDLQRETGDYTMDHVAFDVSTFTVSHEAYQATLSSDPSIDAFRRLRVTEGFARMQREREARHSASDELALRLAKATAAIGDAERILKKVRGTAWQSKARLEFDTEAVFRGHLEDLEAEAGRLKGDTTRYLAAVATVTERLAGAAAPAYAALLADALRGNSDDVPASAVIRVVLEAGRDPQNYVEIDDADHGPADRSAFAAGSVRILSTCLADRLGSTGEAPEPPRGP